MGTMVVLRAGGLAPAEGESYEYSSEMPTRKGKQKAWAEDRQCAITQTVYAQAVTTKVQVVR